MSDMMSLLKTKPERTIAPANPCVLTSILSSKMTYRLNNIAQAVSADPGPKSRFATTVFPRWAAPRTGAAHLGFPACGVVRIRSFAE